MTLGAAAYAALRATGWPALRRRRRGAIFCFHNVVEGPVAHADTSLHLPVTRFARLLDWIAADYRVLPLNELLERVRQGEAVGGLASLTVDDGYTGFLRLGLPVLRSRQLPATMFVVSGAAASPAPFWWDLAGAQGRLTDRSRQAALTEWAGRGDRVVPGLGLRQSALPPDLMPADWKAIVKVMGPDLAIGAHTASHCNLTAVSPETVATEFQEANRAIREALGVEPTIVSYPYGLTSPPVADAAPRAGYRFGVQLGSDGVLANTDSYRIPRINVPATATAGQLACWATGLRWNKPR